MVTGILALLATASMLQQGPATHYRISLKASRSVDRTSSGEEARGGTFAAVAYMTATTTSDAKGRFGHVVIDSVTCSGTGLMSMAFDSAVGPLSRGARYDFPIGSRLEIVPLPTISNTLTNTLAQVALMLFPTIDPHAAVGAAWSDSLDTSPMGDPSDKNHPIITRWKMASTAADTAIAVGDVRGALSRAGRVDATGLVTGSRRLTFVSGVLRTQTSTLSQETMMVGEGATAITHGTGSTTLEIVAVPVRAMSP